MAPYHRLKRSGNRPVGATEPITPVQPIGPIGAVEPVQPIEPIELV